jgi:hypothetical protein
MENINGCIWANYIQSLLHHITQTDESILAISSSRTIHKIDSTGYEENYQIYRNNSNFSELIFIFQKFN